MTLNRKLIKLQNLHMKYTTTVTITDVAMTITDVAMTITVVAMTITNEAMIITDVAMIIKDRAPILSKDNLAPIKDDRLHTIVHLLPDMPTVLLLDRLDRIHPTIIDNLTHLIDKDHLLDPLDLRADLPRDSNLDKIHRLDVEDLLKDVTTLEKGVLPVDPPNHTNAQPITMVVMVNSEAYPTLEEKDHIVVIVL